MVLGLMWWKGKLSKETKCYLLANRGFHDSGVKGCLSDLFLKYGGPFTFTSRLGVNFLKLLFGLVLVSSPTDQGSIDDKIQISDKISVF